MKNTTNSVPKQSKTFVLNPHAVLSSNKSPLRFGEDNDVVIPMCVLEKIQAMKPKLSFGKRRIAKEILDYINSFDNVTKRNGIKQENGSTLYVPTNYHDIQINLAGISEYDKRALQVAKGLQEEGKNVVFITNNSVLQIKAKSIGIKAESLKDDLFPLPKDQYKGRIEVFTTQEAMNGLFEEGFIKKEDIYEYEEYEWVTNQFVLINSENSSALGRFDGERIVKLSSLKKNIYGISAKNAGQKFLLEALMSDAPLVVVKGGAGTGKTFCSLAAALQQYDDKIFNQILVTRPIQTVSDEKIGFLPGDIDDKVGPYLGGIKDNLRMLLNSKGHEKDGRKTEEDGTFFFERNIIQIQPIGYIRGRTIVDTFFIIDETQNIDPEDIKSIVSRAGQGSKFVFLGDPSQVDNPKLTERYNGLVYLSEMMKGQKVCYQITMEEEESVRGELAKLAIQIL